MALFRKGFIALAKIPQTARRDNIDRPPDGFAKLYIEDNQEQRTAVMVPRFAPRCGNRNRGVHGMSEPVEPRPRSRRLRVLPMLVVALAAGTFGAFVSHAFGQGFAPPWYAMMHGPATPAQIDDRVNRMVRHLAIEIDATPEQQGKLQTIFAGAIKDLLPAHEQVLAARQQARDLLTQATIDRAAIEKFRAERVAAIDTASKRIAQALSDAAEVLTPEQRNRVSEMLPPVGTSPWH
jgi:periplasmic protein CpxP/Spy